ncbi:MAG: response regulator [Rhodospirillaceae bacterium]|jgi:DNA-binding response OmpR family regulator|nr:response regulator [Rhodospirillaceae bacterium]MBT3910382.1 response regulator [Rhodospirillaceae bacterium]MBT5512690.1 response regulator [Rhodospirillaceae bacterium]MBT6086850.1 response regulator [Rhodospirillaceae bacterium]
MLDLSDKAAGMRLLCLDTDREWLNILSRELGSIGFANVNTVIDPKNALSYLQMGEVDLVITHHDLKFVKFLRHAEASPDRKIPVIMVTSQVGPDEIFAIRDAGVNEIAIKPCSIKQLVQRIEAVATNPRRFVWSPHFTGPDRRRKEVLLSGPERREPDDA